MNMNKMTQASAASSPKFKPWQFKYSSARKSNRKKFTSFRCVCVCVCVCVQTWGASECLTDLSFTSFCSWADKFTLNYVKKKNWVNSKKVENVNAYQYIRSVHSLLKWQQPNIPAAVSVSNVNQTTKDRKKHSSLNNFGWGLLINVRKFT